MKTTVSSRGRITIPKKLRERLKIDTGTVLRLDEEDGRIVLIKDVLENPDTQVFGILRHLHQEADSVMDEFRSGGVD